MLFLLAVIPGGACSFLTSRVALVSVAALSIELELVVRPPVRLEIVAEPEENENLLAISDANVPSGFLEKRSEPNLDAACVPNSCALETAALACDSTSLICESLAADLTKESATSYS